MIEIKHANNEVMQIKISNLTVIYIHIVNCEMYMTRTYVTAIWAQNMNVLERERERVLFRIKLKVKLNENS